MTKTTTIRISHCDDDLDAEVTYRGNHAQCADFASKFSDFCSNYGKKVEAVHWSGLTRYERDLARNVNLRDSYGNPCSGKIPAIKAHRERTGIGLKDSKDAIEAYLDGVAAGKEP